VADHLDALAHVVEGDHLVGEHEGSLWQVRAKRVQRSWAD